MSRPRIVRRLAVPAIVAALVLVPVGNAFACGALLAPNGTISLTRTTTLAAYHDGIEHYITSFEYAGETSGDVGSIIPLPGVPTKVIKGGGWTLQRLVLETQPQPLFATDVAGAALAAPERAAVILKTKIDSLDVTVLQGGAIAVGNWAREHGFFLPPDAPEILEFYAQRSPIFMAVRFNAKRAAAQGVLEGEGTPVDVVIPTPNPWVPLRILTLGLKPTQTVQADVYLLTDRAPATLPHAVRPNGDPEQQGIVRQANEPASQSLLADLRSDRRMGWLPASGMWLTYLKINTPASTLTNDLAIDASGYGHPDPVAAGYAPVTPSHPAAWPVAWVWVLAAGVLAVVAGLARRGLSRQRV
jgi:Uncharacterized protein conserved in bacteria (DUF2330)